MTPAGKCLASLDFLGEVKGHNMKRLHSREAPACLSRLDGIGGELHNRILECAVSGNADVIVTGDKELLRLRGYGKTKIISLKEYLQE
jgi:hypothetical protein